MKATCRTSEEATAPATGITVKGRADASQVCIISHALFIHFCTLFLTSPPEGLVWSPQNIPSSWSIPNEVPRGPPNHTDQWFITLPTLGKESTWASSGSPLEWIKGPWVCWFWGPISSVFQAADSGSTHRQPFCYWKLTNGKKNRRSR